ncbi:hypothetical protein IMZ48_01495 [Candidatus Bathyarchaeota archaeon]|nr:hypothetical protein [Candidatus Bathyarchaeota archaeon]
MRLIEEGTFVNTVAIATSRMPGFRSISFTDLPHPADCQDSHRSESFAKRPYSANNIPRFVTGPMQWSHMEPDWNWWSPGLPPARILWDLPIAIQKEAGPKLKEMHVHCFPLRADSVDESSVPSPDDLSTAFENLEQAVFSTQKPSGTPFPLVDRPVHILEGTQVALRYISAMVSGPCLKKVDIRPASFSTLSDNSTLHASAISPSLQHLNAPGLTNLSLVHVLVSQSAWDTFCGGLGGSLKEVKLKGVRLLGGGSLTSLDVLGTKTRDLYLDGERWTS